MHSHTLQDDIELYARALFAARNASSAAYAAERSRQLRACGDVEGARVWQEVRDEIEKLSQQRKPASN
jgi:hypothetical protein